MSVDKVTVITADGPMWQISYNIETDLFIATDSGELNPIGNIDERGTGTISLRLADALAKFGIDPNDEDNDLLPMALRALAKRQHTEMAHRLEQIALCIANDAGLTAKAEVLYRRLRRG